MERCRKFFKFFKDRDVLNYGKYCVKLHRFPQIDTFDDAYPLMKNIDNGRDVKAKPDILYNRFRPGIFCGQAAQSALFQSNQWTIQLAGTIKKADVFQIDWTEIFEDIEDQFGLHRFLWLYRKTVEASGTGFCESDRRGVTKIIYSWIDQFDAGQTASPEMPAWYTYTVVERLVSWIFVLCMVSDGDISDHKIVSSIFRQTEFIAGNLEYRGEKYTGNHLSNDGRGLYIAGMSLGLSYYTELGKRIILNEYDRVVVDGQFLREGSVHYQFLYTKWFCDIYLFAILFRDNAFADQIAERLVHLSDGCRFFLYKDHEGKWRMPFIGDISPDYTPDWIIGAPWLAAQLLEGRTYVDAPAGTGVHSLLAEQEGSSSGSMGRDEPAFSEAVHDWAVLKSGGFQLYCHVNNSLYPNNAPGHFHHDSGSICLVYKGVDLLVDAGRYNYMQEGPSDSQRSYKGHNVVVIDNCNPELEMRRFYDDDFLKDYAGNAPELQKDKNGITVTIDYGGRIRGLKKVKREIRVTDSGVIMLDTVAGKGLHEVQFLFHFPAFWETEKAGKGIRLFYHQMHLMIDFEETAGNVPVHTEKCTDYSYISSQYGDLSHCKLAVVKKKVKLPYQLKTTISIVER